MVHCAQFEDKDMVHSAQFDEKDMVLVMALA